MIYKLIILFNKINYIRLKNKDFIYCKMRFFNGVLGCEKYYFIYNKLIYSDFILWILHKKCRKKALYIL